MIPRTMRVAALDRIGGSEVLMLHIVPVSVPQAGEVLIAVHPRASESGMPIFERLVSWWAGTVPARAWL
jgi:hypothetical protein